MVDVNITERWEKETENEDHVVDGFLVVFQSKMVNIN